jgi:hypothetical protein
MNWRTLFGLDLAGQLERRKRQYKGDTREFNFQNVWLSTTRWNTGRITVAAGAFCRDPNVTGFGSLRTLWFYRSPEFLTNVEADAHVERELRRASSRHKQTQFYRERILPSVEVSGKIERDVTIFESYLDGTWQESSNAPSMQKCSGCGNDVDSDVCKYCGEPSFL